MSESSGARLWRITIPVIATAAEMEVLTDRIVHALCPDRDHEGPCTTPWAMNIADGDSLPRAEQRRLSEAVHDPKA
ncbi:hypothetical protein [Actinoplanes sp. NBRC 101535]|uniref:hypothetical protein n=1 Tax=Actinoplanes sp. NBRC 101535 TaxID=3032196 RepID=UPI0025569C8C|nr:hypothetical protein [Actinoplanes sp. NBRC 101535]